MLFARWQHHIQFGSGFPYAPLKAMLKKISKWSRIEDSFRITPRNWITGSFCHSQHSQKISEISVHNFWSYLADTQADRQTNKQTNKQTNQVWQKHNLLGRGKHSKILSRRKSLKYYKTIVNDFLMRTWMLWKLVRLLYSLVRNSNILMHGFKHCWFYRIFLAFNKNKFLLLPFV